MNTLNLSATLNVFRLLTRPTLCLPHATVSTFNHLPIPLSSAFGKYRNVDIKAVVLDKDNCFAYPKSNEVYKPYEV
jgi:phosphatidylglycerophosphatase GEP4